MITSLPAQKITFEQALAAKKKSFSFARLFKYLSVVSVAITLAALVAVIGFVMINGLPHISWHFLFGENSYKEPSISGPLVSTGSLILVALLIALPVGVAAALLLTEYTKKKSRFARIVQLANDCLSGVPSIIFGLFGMLFFVKAAGFGFSIWSGGITLSLMILPTVIRSVEESLKSVPDIYREGSLALGAGKMRTTLRIVLPNASRGIITAGVLSIGRIISESAVLIFTAGSTRDMIKGFNSQGASLAVAMYMFIAEGRGFNEAYATAAVLVILVAAINLLAAFIESRRKNDT